jgi:dTDP-4-dehydrorhamnose reductase
MRRLALVLGAGGQLGQAMAVELSRQHETVAFSREELDLASAPAVATTVAAVCPDVIVNCAAYTEVDAAQQEPSRAFAVNAWAVRTLAAVAAEIDATLIHYSTDFVFDGATDRPYTERDPPNPRGVYAASKLLGEWFAAEAPRHYVLRVESLFGGPKTHSSVDHILANIRRGAPVRAFVDRTVSPSYVDDVVAATAALISRTPAYGLYHCVNDGWTTWSALAREIARLAGHPDAPIVDVPMAEARLPTPRPQFAALSGEKLARTGIVMPSWQDALRRHLAKPDASPEPSGQA